MKLTRKAATRALTLVAAGGVVLGMSATALAAPAYEPDPTNQLGQILFYDASGNLVTSGNVNDSPNFKFAVATTDDPQSANTTATLYGYTPVNGQPPAVWSGEQLSGTTTFPVASPANVAAAGAHRPVVTMQTGALRLADLITDFPNTNGSGSGYENRYQLRILTDNNTKWWAADVLVNPANGTWTLDYPALAATATTLSATPPSPQTAPASAVTLTATVTANAPGTVKFMDTDANTQVGTTQTLPASASNTASVTIPPGLAVGTHHYSATYSPPVGALFNTSSGTLSYQVNSAPADVTSTTLSVTPLPATVGDSFTLSSHVSDTTVPASTPVGSVTWLDNGNPIAGPTAVDASGNASAGPSAFGLGSGNHSIVAHFAPANPAQFNSSDSAAVPFSLNPAAGDPCLDPGPPATNTCSDDQDFKVTVPTGTLVISTPWTPANPFDLGTLALSPDGTYMHTKADFGHGSAPASEGVTVTDTRSGDLAWTAAVTTTDFVSGANKINGCNLGFTSVGTTNIPPNALGTAAKPVTTTDVPNQGPVSIYGPADACSVGLKGGPHGFAHANNGIGSIYIGGVMDLYAPTSTPPGEYHATVTFTVF